MKTSGIPNPENDRGASVFSRVLVGVDGGEPGFEACRQAARLADPDAPIDVIAVVHLSEQVRAVYDEAEIADQLQEAADNALDAAVALVGDRARPRCVDGFVTQALIQEVKVGNGTLLALGAPGHWRIGEIMIGGVAGELLHTAPCAVLIARRPAEPARFPTSIVVGSTDHPAPSMRTRQPRRQRRALRRPCERSQRPRARTSSWNESSSPIQGSRQSTPDPSTPS